MRESCTACSPCTREVVVVDALLALSAVIALNPKLERRLLVACTPLPDTKRDRTTVAPKSSRIIPTDGAELMTERSAYIAEVTAAVRDRLSGLVMSPTVRLLVGELERYERTVDRWSVFRPTEVQCEALAEEVAALAARVQRLVDSMPGDRPAVARTSASRPPATTTKLPRVTNG